MEIVAFDTGFVIWAIQGVARLSQQDMALRAEYLMNQLDEVGAIVGVPTAVLGEYLVGIAPEEHESATNAIERIARIWSFDRATSKLFARLARRQEAMMAELAQRSDLPLRQKLRIDLFILATAVQRGATAIYSEDRHMARLAEGLIEVRAMPPLPAPPNDA